MYSFDKPKHKLYINIFFLLFSTVLQLVTKFAGVQISQCVNEVYHEPEAADA